MSRVNTPTSRHYLLGYFQMRMPYEQHTVIRWSSSAELASSYPLTTKILQQMEQGRNGLCFFDVVVEPGVTFHFMFLCMCIGIQAFRYPGPENFQRETSASIITCLQSFIASPDRQISGNHHIGHFLCIPLTYLNKFHSVLFDTYRILYYICITDMHIWFSILKHCFSTPFQNCMTENGTILMDWFT